MADTDLCSARGLRDDSSPVVPKAGIARVKSDKHAFISLTRAHRPLSPLSVGAGVQLCAQHHLPVCRTQAPCRLFAGLLERVHDP